MAAAAGQKEQQSSGGVIRKDWLLLYFPSRLQSVSWGSCGRNAAGGTERATPTPNSALLQHEGLYQLFSLLAVFLLTHVEFLC
ncbi:hypothetical protein NQZ68_040203 [Dissostichus eleginoides]|nr:hypothetical protein NQZ68_040203 [Dissostichus eleginoides]